MCRCCIDTTSPWRPEPICPARLSNRRSHGSRLQALAAAAAREPKAAQSFETACQLAQAVAKGDRYRLMQLLAGYEKDKPAAARLLADLASVAAAELAGAGRFGMSAHQAARTASQCGEALQNMNRNLNQKLLLTLLAARIAR